jgi:hypothetical protein
MRRARGRAARLLGSFVLSTSALACNQIAGDAGPVFVCSVDLSTDLENCGACGHSCQGVGACQDGRCQVFPVEQKPDAIVDIAADTTNLYFATADTVYAEPLSQLGAGSTITGLTNVKHLAVGDDGTVYWVSPGTVSTAQFGATPVVAQTLVAMDADNPGGIAVDGTYVYWTNTWTSSSCSSPNPDAGSCQCPGSGTIWRAPKTGGAPDNLAYLQECPTALVVADQSPYFVNTTNLGSVVCTAANHSVSYVESRYHSDYPGSDGSHVYYVTYDGPPPSDYTVNQKPVPPSPEPSARIGAGNGTVGGLVAQGGDVYWTAAEVDGSGARWCVVHAVTAAFGPFELTRAPAEGCGRITLGNGYVYWVQQRGASDPYEISRTAR